ncbi:MAG: hypothetical protein WKG07_16190 [Hymenobacter sp.]
MAGQPAPPTGLRPTNWSNGVPTSLLDASRAHRHLALPVDSQRQCRCQRPEHRHRRQPGRMSGGTLDVKAGLSNSGTLSATAGTVSLSGPTTQIIGGSGSTRFRSLTITNNAGALQSGAVGVHGVLAPTSGNLTTNGQTLTLLSDAAGTALVDNTGTGT